MFKLQELFLEGIKIKIIKEKDEFFLQFFDNKTDDEKRKINIKSLNKKDLKVRLNKKTKIFE